MDVAKIDHVKDAAQGAWMTVTDPKTGADMVYTEKDGEVEVTKPVQVLFIGGDSEEFRRLNQAFKQKQVELAKRNQWSSQAEDDALRELMSSAARDWRGFTKEGKPLPFSKSELFDLMGRFPALIEQANNWIGGRANFIKG